MRYRIVIADDHPMWRDAVRADLERDGDLLVVGQAADAAAVVTTAAAHRPDLVLLDLNMPGGGGAAAIPAILERSPPTKVLMLSASGEAADVLAAVKAGAGGYLLKSATGAELLAAVRAVLAGEPVFSPSLAALVLGEFRRVAAGATTGGSTPNPSGLTDREAEVLRLVAKGYAYREIAAKLVVSVRTVQNHVQNIFRKLQVNSRHELMRLAIDTGLDRSQ